MEKKVMSKEDFEDLVEIVDVCDFRLRVIDRKNFNLEAIASYLKQYIQVEGE